MLAGKSDRTRIRSWCLLAAGALLCLGAPNAHATYPEALGTLVHPGAEPSRGMELGDIEGGDLLVADSHEQGSEASQALTPGQEPTYVVSRIVLQYAQEHPDHPEISSLMSLEVALSASNQALVGPRPGLPVALVAISDFGLRDTGVLTPTAIRAINHRVVNEFNSLGFAGVLVEPNPEDIDARSGRDLRPTDRTELRIQIWTGRVARIRTFASGERVPLEERIDNPAHARIVERSPLQPVGAAGPGSLMRLNMVEDYVARLNRHPGRRVDVALSPAQDPGGVFLDYLVAENKPWAAYFQLSDTGTKSTGHARQRFGFMHTQFTGKDDILQLDYFTSQFDDVNGYFASYERPWFDSETTRIKFSGSIAGFTSEDFGNSLADYDGDSRYAGVQFFTNIFQRGRTFIDLTYGARWEYYRTENELALITARDNFFIPGIGLRMDRRSETSNLFGMLNFEGNVSGVANTDGSDPNGAAGLGRFNPDEDWSVLSWDASASTYLEPLFNRSAWEDLSTPDSSTLAHEVSLRFSGQFAFDRRLIPGAQRVAGGMYTVRGYDTSLIAGDSIYLGSAEYQLHIPRLCNIGPPVNLPGFGEFRLVPEQAGGRPDWDLIFRLFVDAGRIMQSDRERFEAHATLVGAGTGLELQMRRNIRMRLDLGWALTDVTRRRGGIIPDEDLQESGDFNANFSITTLY